MSKNALWILGMVASIAVAIAGDAKHFDPPWNRILSLGGLAGTAITAFLAQKPREEWSADKRQEKRAEEASAWQEPEI